MSAQNGPWYAAMASSSSAKEKKKGTCCKAWRAMRILTGEITSTYVLAAASIFCLAGAGCTSSTPPDAVLRQTWARGWIDSVRPNQRLYDKCVAEEKQGRRGDAFANLISNLDILRRQEALSGSELLDLVGPPDLWGIDPDSQATLLVYFYWPSGVKDKWAAMVFVDGTGKVSTIAWNLASANDLSMLKEWH